MHLGHHAPHGQAVLPPRSGLAQTLGRTSDTSPLQHLRASEMPHADPASDMPHLTRLMPPTAVQRGPVQVSSASRQRSSNRKRSATATPNSGLVSPCGAHQAEQHVPRTGSTNRIYAKPATRLACSPCQRRGRETPLGSIGIKRLSAPATVRPNTSLNADPLRRPCLPVQPPVVIIGRTGKPVRLRGRRYLER